MQMIVPQSHKQHNPCRHVVLSWKNYMPCMRRHSTCPMYRVNHRPTTQCKCQWENQTPSQSRLPSHNLKSRLYLFTLPSCVFLGNRTFRGLTAGLLHPPTFFRLSPVDTLFNQVFRLFTSGGIYVKPEKIQIF